MAQHCCIIGGAGFIGSAIIPVLLKMNRKVSVIGRKELPDNLLPSDVTYLRGDYGNRDFVGRVLQDVDEVIDLAFSTVPKTSFDDPVNDIITNLPQSVGLFEVASQLKIKKIIFVSSGGTVYGQARYLPIREDHPTNPVSPYGITKLATEKYASMYHFLKKLPVICVRPGNAYGETQKPYKGQGFIATAVHSILDGRELTLFGENGTIRDYIHCDDLARGIVAALESGIPNEIYNIGTGIGFSNRQVIDLIRKEAENSGFKLKLNILPAREFDVAENVLDSSLLNQLTGWIPEINIEKGIKDIWSKALKNYKQK